MADPHPGTHDVPRSAASPDHEARTRRLLDRVAPAPRPFDVRLWNGATLPGGDGGPSRAARPVLVLADPHALGRALTPPFDLSAGEAFVRGEIDVEGDLETVLAGFAGLLDRARDGSPIERLKVANDVGALRRRAARAPVAGAADLQGRRHGRARDAHAIRHHYDLPVDFYRLWLDRRMTYSCGYFPEGDETLDAAQEAKLDLVCRKLRLAEGHRLLDVGCGWGSLVIFAAERYRARAHGVTLAERQAEEARRRLAAAGLNGRATVAVRDYRDLEGTFDRVASVGMSEHVGRAHLEAYFRAAWERLAPGGLMLNHAISRGPTAGPTDSHGGETFIQRYVFPDGEIVDLGETIRAAEAAGFEVRDVEDLREHYARTLRHWVARLESAWDEAVAVVGQERARVWRLFMAASALQFARGRIAVHQVLLGRPDARGRVAVPSTRADLYRS